MSRRYLTIIFWLSLTALSAACDTNDDDDTGPIANDDDTAVEYSATSPLFDLDSPLEGLSFFDIPFPSTLRLKEGYIDVRGFPNPAAIPFLDEQLEMISTEVEGFGPGAPMYVRFDGGIDTATLPASAAAAMEPTASVMLVNTEPESSYCGRQYPFDVKFYAEAGIYYPSGLLVIAPIAGIPLAPLETHALVITDGVLGADDLPLEPSPVVQAALRDKPDDTIPASLYDDFAPLRAWLADMNMAPASIVNASVWTPRDPTAELLAMTRYIDRHAPPPEPLYATGRAISSGWNIDATAYYSALNFQHGEPPYTEGGSFQFDEHGEPIPYRSEPMTLSIVVPNQPPPPDGWPTVIYGHGSPMGGRTEVKDTFSGYYFFSHDFNIYLSQFLAYVAVDLPVHNTRSPGHPNANQLFINVFNWRAARDNVRQAALDVYQLARLVDGFEIDWFDYFALGFAPYPLRLSAQPLFYYGVSMGAMTGIGAVAVTPAICGAVLSAPGGSFTKAMLYKSPSTVAAVRGILQFGDDVLDEFHPLTALLQTFIEEADPVNYGRLYYAENARDRAPSVILNVGTDDNLVPPVLSWPVAAAIGASAVEPVALPVPPLDLLGIAPLPSPVSGNVSNALGVPATAVLTQFEGGGHESWVYHPGWQRLFDDIMRGELPVYYREWE